jgi:NAD(P)H-dependent FMN reductase
MASAFAQGASAETAVQCSLLNAREASADDLLVADGCAFVCPEMLGSMSGVMKDFFDRTYYPLLDRIQGRPCLIMVCAGSDGSGAVRQMQRIITGWRLREIAPPVIVCTHAQTADAIAAPKVLSLHDVQVCRDSGQAFATGLGMGLF